MGFEPKAYNFVFSPHSHSLPLLFFLDSLFIANNPLVFHFPLLPCVLLLDFFFECVCVHERVCSLARFSIFIRYSHDARMKKSVCTKHKSGKMENLFRKFMFHMYLHSSTAFILLNAIFSQPSLPSLLLLVVVLLLLLSTTLIAKMVFACKAHLFFKIFYKHT